MAQTLELYDGSTTINLLDSTYRAAVPVAFRPPPAAPVLAGVTLRGVRYSPRQITIALHMSGTSVSDLRSKIRDVETMLAKAEGRQAQAQSTVTIVVLKVQTGATNADDVSYRVLRGELSMPSGILQEPAVSQATARGVQLTLLLEPFGRLAAVSVTAATLENEQDGSGLNYMDITSITGTHGALLQLKVHDTNNGGGNAWVGDKKMWIGRRSGERRTDDLFLQGEEETALTAGTAPHVSSITFHSDGALAVTAASGGQVSEMRWESGATESLSQTWASRCYASYQIAGGSIPHGLYRVLVRAAASITGDIAVVAADMRFALGWVFGGKSKVPVSGDDVAVSALGTYETLDLGELVLPPVATPDGYTPATFDLRIHGIYYDTAANTIESGENLRWQIDYIMLFPIDEGSAIVSSVGTADRVLVDNLSEMPGAYLLNTSDVVQEAATFVGGPFLVGPEDTRIYWLRDDSGNPTTVQATVTPSYTPLVIGI